MDQHIHWYERTGAYSEWRQESAVRRGQEVTTEMGRVIDKFIMRLKAPNRDIVDIGTM